MRHYSDGGHGRRRRAAEHSVDVKVSPARSVNDLETEFRVLPVTWLAGRSSLVFPVTIAGRRDRFLNRTVSLEGKF